MAQLMPLPLTVSCFSKIQIGSGTTGVTANYYPPVSQNPNPNTLTLTRTLNTNDARHRIKHH